MTKTMRREYHTIAKHAEWRWFHNKEYDQYYLHLAGHRVATVKPAFAGWGAWCPGDLVAYRKSRQAAQRAAIDAVRVWVAQAAVFATGDAVQP